LVWVLF